MRPLNRGRLTAAAPGNQAQWWGYDVCLALPVVLSAGSGGPGFSVRIGLRRTGSGGSVGGNTITREQDSTRIANLGYRVVVSPETERARNIVCREPLPPKARTVSVETAKPVLCSRLANAGSG